VVGGALVTRLLSHRTLLARLDEERREDPAAMPPTALLVVEVDRWEELHCSRGGSVQRQTLAQAAGRLRQAVTRRGILGDRTALGQVSEAVFLVVLRGAAAGEPAGAAALLQEALRARYEANGMPVYLTASCGAAPFTAAHAAAADAFADAMAALAVARRRGGGARVVFDDALRQGLAATFDIVSGLRQALESDGLVLYFQPIVALDTGALTGLEALLRWPQADGQLRLPATFVEVAERSDLVVDIDRWVIEAACRQLKAWLARGLLDPTVPVSVNVSGLHFSRPDLLATIDRSLRATGLYGRSLTIEITESAMMRNAPFTRDMLAQLRALGVRVSIDDFGTGYASLANLRQFDVDALKIDRSFVARIDTDAQCREIVKTVIALAQGLGKRVVAEGIETQAQRNALRELGCRLGQGYLFARPAPAEAVPSLLHHPPTANDLFTV